MKNPQCHSPRKSAISPEQDLIDILNPVAPPNHCFTGDSRRCGAHRRGLLWDHSSPVRRAKTPVAPLVLPHLPTLISGGATCHDCAICQDAAVPATAIRLPCGHVYHPPCITQWLQEQNTCPICRSSLPTLVHFTTPRGQLRLHEETAVTLRPQTFRRADLPLLETLHALYRSWVICTYHHQQLPLTLSPDVMEDREALIAYLAECNVIQLLAEVSE
jgi:Ring finger domain